MLNQFRYQTLSNIDVWLKVFWSKASLAFRTRPRIGSPGYPIFLAIYGNK